MLESHSLPSDIAQLHRFILELEGSYSDIIHALQSELEESEARYQALLEEIRLALSLIHI